MNERKKYEPPKAGKGDVAHTIVKAGMAAIPYGGGAAAELFAALVKPPLDRRRQEWMEEMGEGLRKLEEKWGINLEELRDDEDFIDTVMYASQIAIRNSQAEKRQALRNAVLNAALPEAPEQSLQHIFIDIIDTFTEWHFRILNLLHNPEEYRPPITVAIEGIEQILLRAYPELTDHREFYDLIVSNLHIDGLIKINTIHMVPDSGVITSHTTDMGKQFLKFITL
jgi:hypothetical protein